MTQHWMFVIWGYVRGVVLLTVLQGWLLVVNLGNYKSLNRIAGRGRHLEVLQLCLLLLDKIAVISQ